MEYIQSEAELAEVGRRLDSVVLLAADTEAAGYHRYSDRICLLQISTRDSTYIVDTLAVPHLDALQPVLARQETEVVFHDADYDLRLLARDFGIHIAHLFDTKTAAQFLGDRAFGLGSLVEKYLGVKLEKKHQRADWAQRPLPADMLTYAAEDTQYLPALRDQLCNELVKLGRLKWAEEEFRITEKTRWSASDREPFLKAKGARDLRPRQLAALRELYAWREAAAELRDVATFRVLSNEALVAIARRMPDNLADLEGISGLSPSVIERRGNDLLAAVRRAARVADADLPRFPRSPRRPAPDAEFEKRTEKLKTVRDRIADELNLDRGFLLPRNQIEDIARVGPHSVEELAQIEGVRRWQVEVLAEPLLATLES